MSVKTQVNFSSAYRLLHPMHTILVSCVGNAGKPNITTVAWAMPTSVKPALVAISLAATRHSHTLIEESGEFIINIPTLETLQAVYACGNLTGRSFDKFKKANLTPMPAKKVKAPAIRECIAHIECEVIDKFETGDHTVFVVKSLMPTRIWVLLVNKATIIRGCVCFIMRAETTFWCWTQKATKPNPQLFRNS